jgi:serine/threonine-protein kinase
MHGNVAGDPQFVGRFHREAKAASRFDHPNSIRIVSFGEEKDGLLYIVMEYVEGRDLYRVIHEDYPLSNEKIADIMMQALGALAVAHERGLIHRDLKPENLMIVDSKDDDDPTKARYLVKVCDFGIAKITEKDEAPRANEPSTAGQRLTTQGLVVGTPEYMSPEQARGEKLDARSDIYSMGIILYQLLTGRTPFTGDSALSIVLKHVTDTAVPPREIWAGVHRGLEEVCLRAMMKAPDARFQSAREMRAAIKAAIEGRPLPVDHGTAPTMEMPPGGMTAPGMPSPSVRPASTAPGPTSPIGVPAAHAPTVAGAFPPSSKLTPLGAEAAPQQAQKKSATGIVVGVFAVLAAAGATLTYVVATKKLQAKPAEVAIPTSSGSQVAVEVAVPSSAPTSVATVASVASAAPPPPDVATAKRPPVAHVSHTTPAATKPTPDPAPAAPPPPTPSPQPDPAPAAPPPPPATPPPAPPAPAPPAFNAATCRAQLGAVRSNGAVNGNNLRLNGTGAQMTTCAKRLAHPPSGGASVHLDFTDNKRLRGASCAGCPSEINACVVNAAKSTTSIQFNGEVTGDPAFDIPVTFVCD